METTATKTYVNDDGNGVHMPPDAEIQKESYKDLLACIPKRILALIKKMVGVKMFIWYATTALLLTTDKLPAWVWLSVTGFVIGGREMMKYLKDVRR